jgi:hypothetical protein
MDDHQPVEHAILRTLAYSDVFSFPMSAAEIHFYLIGLNADRYQVEQALLEDLVPSGRVYAEGGNFCLPWRQDSIERRRRREQAAATQWPAAQRFGLLIGCLPFVRMVAVTGALAVNNVDPGDDIDYLIVTQPGRLWLCRAMIIGVVKLARGMRVRLCPNYLLSENALRFPDASLYPAHEVVQMVPIAGVPVYRRIRQINSWTADYLPNSTGMPPSRPEAEGEPGRSAWREGCERVFQGRVMEKVERWEMERKIRKFRTLRTGMQESAFGRDWCKGHFDDHGLSTMHRYQERLKALNLSP